MCASINGYHVANYQEAVAKGYATQEEVDALLAKQREDRREWYKAFYAKHPEYVEANGVTLDAEGYVVEEKLTAS